MNTQQPELKRDELEAVQQLHQHYQGVLRQVAESSSGSRT